MRDEKKEICRIFSKASHFVVTSHQNIDGDGLNETVRFMPLGEVEEP
jgi:hypothetical protein